MSDSDSGSAAFGRALRAAREVRGISQLALARDADLSRSFLWGLEGGTRNPTLRTIADLARALGMLPSELIREAEAAGLAGLSEPQG